MQTSTWHKGRVVLLGDAAHCPSSFSSMGATGSLVGAYILAGEISRNPDNLSHAFAKYDETLRPFVDEIQNLNSFLIRSALPNTKWGVAIIHLFGWLICFLRIPELVARYSNKNKGGWIVSKYPENRLL